MSYSSLITSVTMKTSYCVPHVTSVFHKMISQIPHTSHKNQSYSFQLLHCSFSVHQRMNRRTHIYQVPSPLTSVAPLHLVTTSLWKRWFFCPTHGLEFFLSISFPTISCFNRSKSLWSKEPVSDSTGTGAILNSLYSSKHVEVNQPLQLIKT